MVLIYSLPLPKALHITTTTVNLIDDNIETNTIILITIIKTEKTLYPIWDDLCYSGIPVYKDNKTAAISRLEIIIYFLRILLFSEIKCFLACSCYLQWTLMQKDKMRLVYPQHISREHYWKQCTERSLVMVIPLFQPSNRTLT